MKLSQIREIRKIYTAEGLQFIVQHINNMRRSGNYAGMSERDMIADAVERLRRITKGDEEYQDRYLVGTPVYRIVDISDNEVIASFNEYLSAEMAIQKIVQKDKFWASAYGRPVQGISSENYRIVREVAPY